MASETPGVNMSKADIYWKIRAINKPNPLSVELRFDYGSAGGAKSLEEHNGPDDLKVTLGELESYVLWLKQRLLGHHNKCVITCALWGSKEEIIVMITPEASVDAADWHEVLDRALHTGRPAAIS